MSRSTRRRSSLGKRSQTTVPSVVSVTYFRGETDDGNRRTSNRKKASKPILSLKIVTSHGETKELKVFRGSTSLDLSTKFCEDHMILPKFVPLIASFVDENMDQFEGRNSRDNVENLGDNQKSNTSSPSKPRKNGDEHSEDSMRARLQALRRSDTNDNEDTDMRARVQAMFRPTPSSTHEPGSPQHQSPKQRSRSLSSKRRSPQQSSRVLSSAPPPAAVPPSPPDLHAVAGNQISFLCVLV